MATDLSRRCASLDELAKTTVEELMLIPGVGPNIAQSIVDWFSRPANLDMLEKLRRVGVWPRAETGPQMPSLPQTLENLSFVVTGTLPNFSRETVKDFIEQHGGRVSDSVSKKTSYLILGENPGSKFEKARTLGVPILDEDGLRRLAAG